MSTTALVSAEKNSSISSPSTLLHHHYPTNIQIAHFQLNVCSTPPHSWPTSYLCILPAHSDAVWLLTVFLSDFLLFQFSFFPYSVSINEWPLCTRYVQQPTTATKATTATTKATITTTIIFCFFSSFFTSLHLCCSLCHILYMTEFEIMTSEVKNQTCRYF